MSELVVPEKRMAYELLKILYDPTSMEINLMAPMEPIIATHEQTNIMEIFNPQVKSIFGLLTTKQAIDGITKSRGVNPMAPHKATKSPKKGIAHAINVINTIQIVVIINRFIMF